MIQNWTRPVLSHYNSTNYPTSGNIHDISYFLTELYSLPAFIKYLVLFLVALKLSVGLNCQLLGNWRNSLGELSMLEANLLLHLEAYWCLSLVLLTYNCLPSTIPAFFFFFFKENNTECWKIITGHCVYHVILNKIKRQNNVWGCISE